jgi:hypothetical protein
LIGEEGGDFSIKLEDQVLITEEGFENLTAPYTMHLWGDGQRENARPTRPTK